MPRGYLRSCACLGCHSRRSSSQEQPSPGCPRQIRGFQALRQAVPREQSAEARPSGMGLAASSQREATASLPAPSSCQAATQTRCWLPQPARQVLGLCRAAGPGSGGSAGAQQDGASCQALEQLKGMVQEMKEMSDSLIQCVTQPCPQDRVPRVPASPTLPTARQKASGAEASTGQAELMAQQEELDEASPAAAALPEEATAVPLQAKPSLHNLRAYRGLLWDCNNTVVGFADIFARELEKSRVVAQSLGVCTAGMTPAAPAGRRQSQEPVLHNLRVQDGLLLDSSSRVVGSAELSAQ
ncbi:uncharacterized protein LOC135183745 [Pogoniulus pusillus]|uniref:uncharacterized protein LOC135183745 n=1 Tax=Pogoniulus pusillus TaxID=488313 RepID=UPI0030B98EA5